jgi:hypothetical protein
MSRKVQILTPQELRVRHPVEELVVVVVGALIVILCQMQVKLLAPLAETAITCFTSITVLALREQKYKC